jgi:hypothetical protein
MFDESDLHGMEVVGLANAFNGGDLIALVHGGQG